MAAGTVSELRASEKMRAAACCGRAVPRRGESESSPAPWYRTRAKRVGVHSLGLIVCLRAPRPKIHIVIAPCSTQPSALSAADREYEPAYILVYYVLWL